MRIIFISISYFLQSTYNEMRTPTEQIQTKTKKGILNSLDRDTKNRKSPFSILLRRNGNFYGKRDIGFNNVFLPLGISGMIEIRKF